MSQCATVQKYFSSYIDQTIDPQTQQQVEQHIKMCNSCAKAVSNIKYLSARFKNVESIQPSDSFDQKLRERIIENRPVISGTNHIKTVSYAFSAAVILIAVFIFVNSDLNNPNQIQAIPAPENPNVQSAGVNQGTAGIQDIDQKEKMAIAVDDSSNTEQTMDEEQRPLNLVDQ